MKRFFTLLIALGLTEFTNAQNTIPNASFENWHTNFMDSVPDSWSPGLGWSAYDTIGTPQVMPESALTHGMYSLRMISRVGDGFLLITKVVKQGGADSLYLDYKINSFQEGALQVDIHSIGPTTYARKVINYGTEGVISTLSMATNIPVGVDTFNLYLSVGPDWTGGFPYGFADVTIDNLRFSNEPNSISEAGEEEMLTVFPNPAKDIVTITVDETILGGVATITDLTGRRMSAAVLAMVNSQWSMVNFANGIYFVTVTDKEGRSATKKLVVSK